MKALFGVVSLLVVLAVVGVLAMKQMKAVDHSVAASLPPTVAGGETTAAAPTASTVRERSQQIQQRVQDDVAKALAQGMQRNKDADQ
jgi:hypothetical protein